MTQEEIEAMEEQEHFSNVLQSFAYYFIYSSKIYTRMHTDWTTIPEAHKKYALIIYTNISIWIIFKQKISRLMGWIWQ